MRLTTDEVAEHLRVSRWTAARLMSAGQIPSAKIRGRWTCASADLDAYIESQTTRVEPTRRRRRRSTPPTSQREGR